MTNWDDRIWGTQEKRQTDGGTVPQELLGEDSEGRREKTAVPECLLAHEVPVLSSMNNSFIFVAGVSFKAKFRK